MIVNQLEFVAAHIEICNAKSRHIRLLDTGELDAYAAMLTEDYELDVTAVAPIPAVKGRDSRRGLCRTSPSAARSRRGYSALDITTIAGYGRAGNGSALPAA